MNTLDIQTPWKSYRKNLLEVAAAPSDNWLDEEDLHDVMSEAHREGISARTVLTCRQAEATLREAAEPVTTVLPPHRPRILLVEPDQGTAEKLRQVLVATGRYEVEVATGAQEALNCCRQQAPDLLITEMALTPSSNGGSLAHYVRSVTNRRIPVIILENVLVAADVSIVSTRNALHLCKPVKLKALLHCVVHLLQAAN